MVYQSSSRALMKLPTARMMGLCLQTLPVELICLILDILEMPDLLACSVLSRHIRKVVKDSSRLQYTIGLEKHRMVSLLSPSTTPSFATRLKLLQDRESAWKYLEFKQRHELKLPPTGSVYEFVGGLYGNGREDASRTTASISFLELPSVDDSDPKRDLQMWTHTMGDVTIIDFTMDPSQDLLVLVALARQGSKCVYELHLRSIKTNRPHPKAPISILPCLPQPAHPPQPSEIIAAVRVQVSGNLVALLIKEVFESTGAHLEIWNWEIGSQYSSSMSRVSGIDDFTFLTRDCFLLVRPSGRFEVYTFVDPINRNSTPILRATYPFPPLSEGFMYWYISMSSNPAPGYVPANPETSNGKQIYYPRPDERIHACCLYIFNPAHEENPVVHSFVFFLNLKTLLNPPAEWLLSAHQGRNSHTTRTSAPSEVVAVPEQTPQTPVSSVSSSASSVDIPIHGPNPSPTASSSLQPATAVNGIPISSMPHTPMYPPFPTFDSHTPTSPQPPYPHPQSAFSNAPKSPTTPTTSTSSSTGSSSPKSNPITVNVSTMANVTIPWEVWGPRSTRWFEECLSTDWQHAIYGLRTVESVNQEPTPDGLGFAPSPSVHSLGPNANQLPPPNPFPAAQIHVFVNNAAGGQAVPLHQVANSVQQQNQNGAPDDNNDEDSNANGGRASSPRRYLRVRDFNPYAFKDADVIEGSSWVLSEFDCEHTDGEEQWHGSMSETSSRGRVTNGTKTTRSFDVSDSDKANEKGKGKAKGKSKARWRIPRLVTEPSTTVVKGVFTQDIVSSLPYTEVISEDTFEVTDVMMDDCRLLLLKRGKAGKLKRVEVLMM